VVGLGCHRKHHKVQWKLEEFNVLARLSNMVAKKEIWRPDSFEGLLRYYVKLTPTRFIEQWVIPKLYKKLLLELFSSQATPLNGEKDCFEFGVYCGKEWSSKMRLSDHRSKGCPDGPIDLGIKNPSLSRCFPIWLMPNYRKSWSNRLGTMMLLLFN
jgi:hypothetical protein